MRISPRGSPIICQWYLLIYFSKVLFPMSEYSQFIFPTRNISAQSRKPAPIVFSAPLSVSPLCLVFLDKKAQLSLTNPRDAKACPNCSNSTCLQRCRWQYSPIFMRLTAIASEIREIPRNSLKILTYGVQGHPRSSILVPIESPYATCY